MTRKWLSLWRLRDWRCGTGSRLSTRAPSTAPLAGKLSLTHLTQLSSYLLLIILKKLTEVCESYSHQGQIWRYFSDVLNIRRTSSKIFKSVGWFIELCHSWIEGRDESQMVRGSCNKWWSWKWWNCLRCKKKFQLSWWKCNIFQEGK